MADVKIWGRIRQLIQGVDQASVGDDEQIALTEQLAQLVAFDTSPYGEIVKVGRSFETHTTAAVAALAAIGTTASLLQIWNGDLMNGRTLIIDRIWALLITGAAVAEQASIICCPGQTAVAIPTITSAPVLNSLNGNAGADTKTRSTIAALDAVTGVAANWRLAPGQTGGLKPGAVANGGMFVNAEVNGRILLPPGRAMGIHVIADTTTPTFLVGVEWHEKLIRLG